MKFIMAVDKVVGTKVGHSIGFTKGVPQHVPPEAWEEVQAAGAVPEDAAAVAEAQKPAATGKKVVDNPQERREGIYAVYDEMVKLNVRGTFTAQGVPNLKHVTKMVGFDVDAKENDMYWAAYRQERKL